MSSSAIGQLGCPSMDAHMDVQDFLISMLGFCGVYLTFDLSPPTREAINRLCDAVPGGKGAWRKKVSPKG